MKQPTKKLVFLSLALACECVSGFTFMKNWKLPGRRDVNRELAEEKFGDKSKFIVRCSVLVEFESSKRVDLVNIFICLLPTRVFSQSQNLLSSRAPLLAWDGKPHRLSLTLESTM
jgi:hypothetical protein